ncbi:MAG: hypothetical protein KBS52_00385 [Clostridiales bacterium]|nr:hypothetical protein [Candidatus Equinaster intestinalis]
MARVEGSNIKVSVDSTGGFVSVDWTCPYCGEYNAGYYFSNDAETLGSDFEIDHDCEECGKSVTIECRGAEELF